MTRSQPTGTKPALRHCCDFAESRFGGRCGPDAQAHHRAAALRRLGPDLPPWASATWRTIASPRPEPGMPARGLRAVETVEDVGEVAPGRSPARGRARATSPSRTVTSTVPPGGLHLAALSSRFADRALQRGGHAAHRRLVRGRSRRRTPGRSRAGRSTAAATTTSSRTSSGSVACWSPRASSTSVGDERGHLLELLDARRAAAARARPAAAGRSRAQHLDVRAQARRAGAQLVGGVGDQLPLRARRTPRAPRASR